MRTEIKFDTGFADAELLEYHRGIDDAFVTVRTWNDRLVTVNFKDVVGVNDIGIGDIKGIFKIEGSTPLLETVLNQVYEVTPNTHPYRQYEFVNLDDVSCLTVIATDVELNYLKEDAH
ncbi:MAG: hypothetical protein ABI999_17115 [Acidobacteriota bacterium]